MMEWDVEEEIGIKEVGVWNKSLFPEVLPTETSMKNTTSKRDTNPGLVWAHAALFPWVCPATRWQRGLAVWATVQDGTVCLGSMDSKDRTVSTAAYMPSGRHGIDFGDLLTDEDHKNLMLDESPWVCLTLNGSNVSPRALRLWTDRHAVQMLSSPFH